MAEHEQPRPVTVADEAGRRDPERRRRGRPPLMSREALLERIRALARHGDGLFRVHRTHSGLYARARRMYGTWGAAVAAAGLDPREVLAAARRRSMESRFGRRRPPGGA